MVSTFYVSLRLFSLELPIVPTNTLLERSRESPSSDSSGRAVTIKKCVILSKRALFHSDNDSAGYKADSQLPGFSSIASGVNSRRCPIDLFSKDSQISDIR